MNKKAKNCDKKINYFHLALGLLLNILTVVIFIIIYHAYFIAPNINNRQFSPPLDNALEKNNCGDTKNQ